MTRRLKLRFRYNGVIAGIAPVFTVAPVILSAGVGTPVTWLAGTATGTPTPTHTFLVLLNGASQGASYTPVSGDVGKTITVQDTATNASGSAVSTSAGVVVVAAQVALPETAQYTGTVGSVADAGQIDTAAQRVTDGLPAYTGSVYYASTVTAGAADTYNGLSRYPGKLDDNVTVNAAYGPFLTLQPFRDLCYAGSGRGLAPVGSAFLMERGSVWASFINCEVSANEGNTFGAYGTGARPQIKPGNLATAHNAAFWTNGKGFSLRNIDLIGEYSLHTADAQYQITMGINTGSGATPVNISIVNCHVTDFGDAGINLGPACSGALLIQNANINLCKKVPGAQGAGVAGTLTNGRILGCTVDSNGADATFAHNFYCGGTSILLQGCIISNGSSLGTVWHGTDSNVTIADCVVFGNKHGVQFSAGGYGTSEGITNIVVERCKIYNHAAGFGINFNTTSNAVIRNNVLYGNSLNDVVINDFDNGFTIATSKIYVYNNTMQKTGTEDCVLVGGIRTTGVVVKNNIMHSTITTGQLIEYQTNMAVGQLIVDANEYYAPNLTSGQPILWNVAGVATSYTLAAFKTAQSQETIGKYGDPLFTNLATFDLTLQAGSPCKLSAVPIANLAHDKVYAVRSASTPSIGAYE